VTTSRTYNFVLVPMAAVSSVSALPRRMAPLLTNLPPEGPCPRLRRAWLSTNVRAHVKRRVPNLSGPMGCIALPGPPVTCTGDPIRDPGRRHGHPTADPLPPPTSTRPARGYGHRIAVAPDPA